MPAQRPTVVADAPGRPRGISILAISCAIAGSFGILIGLTLLLAASSPDNFVNPSMAPSAALFGVLFAIMSVGAIVFAYGGWKRRPWAWRLGLVLAAGWIGLNLMLVGPNSPSTGLSGVAIGAGILYYLNRPGIRAAFGR